RIPKPFELGILFGTMVERTLDWVYHNDKEGMKDAVEDLREAFTPNPIPQLAMPALETWANKSFFLDRKIEPTAMKNLPRPMRSHPYTSEIAKNIGKTFNISPLMVDNWIRGWSGNLGRTIGEGVEWTFGMGDDVPEVKRNMGEKTPGIRGFLVRDPILA
ncbi:MAG: LPD38 domain-containing protein, partial [Candidatus Thorarchaeota archaeon]